MAFFISFTETFFTNRIMTYKEKLLDPRWQKKRLEILERDKWHCQSCCSNTKTLHVHHLDYISGNDPWDYSNEYLITLCYDCHEEVGRERKIFEERIIKSFRLNFKNSFDQNCAADVFEKYNDIQGIIYLLWELINNQNSAHDVLCELWNKNLSDFFSRPDIIEKLKTSNENV